MPVSPESANRRANWWLAGALAAIAADITLEAFGIDLEALGFVTMACVALSMRLSGWLAGWRARGDRQ